MQRSLFYTLFPPPRFLEMPAVGIDISDVSVHFVELKHAQGGHIIGRFGDLAIPNGVIEGGEIKDAKKLAKILSALRTKYGFEFANVALPEQHAYLVKLKIPLVKKKEIRGAIELRLEDNVPLSPAEAVFDYDIVGVDEKAETMEVMLSVMPLRVVERYSEVLASAGLSPLAFEIEAQAIARCVIPEGDKGTYMIIDFGKTRTGMSIVSGGVVHFTSTVEIGGEAVTTAIKKTLHINEKEAEKVKIEKGLLEHKRDSEVFLAVMSAVGVLKDEANKHYVYWNTHKDSFGRKRPKIEKIILCGGNANLKGLPDFLSEGMQVPVALADAMANVNSTDEYIPPLDFAQSMHFTTSLGLALRPPR